MLPPRRKDAKTCFFAPSSLCGRVCMALSHSKHFLTLHHLGRVFDTGFWIKSDWRIAHAVNTVRGGTHPVVEHAVVEHSIKDHTMASRFTLISPVIHHA